MKRGSLVFMLFKAVTLFFLVVCLVLFALGLLLYSEIVDFQEKWATKEKMLVLLDNNNHALVGITGTFKAGEQPQVLSQKEREDAEKAWKENNAVIMQRYQMILLVTMDTFASLTGEVVYSDMTLTVDQVKQLLLDSTPHEKASALFRQKKMSLPAVADEQLKGLLFGLLFEEAVRQEPLFFITHYRAGSITLIPENFAFSLARHAPERLLGKLKTMIAVSRGD